MFRTCMLAAILVFGMGFGGAANAQSTAPSQWPGELNAELEAFCLASRTGSGAESDRVIADGLLAIYRNSASRSPETAARLAAVQLQMDLFFQLVTDEVGRSNPNDSCAYVSALLTSTAIRAGFILSDRQQQQSIEQAAVEGGVRRYCEPSERELSAYRQTFCSSPTLDTLNYVFQSEATQRVSPPREGVEMTF